MRAMVVKQAMSVADGGKGEISAAYEVFNELIGVFTPMIWAGLFSVFSTATENSPVFVRMLGPGGHFAFAALLRLVARQLVCSIPASELHIGSDEQPSGAATVDSAADKDGFQLPSPPAA